MKKLKLLFSSLALTLVFACNSDGVLTIKIANHTSIDKSTEIVEIPINKVIDAGVSIDAQIVAEDLISGELLVAQLSKGSGEEKTELVLFQPVIKANSTHEYLIRNIKEGEKAPSTDITCYSRFVPERIDDYAWENDKVAFRTYGPEAQRLTEAGEPGGIISNGIDCWLKKVEYPIIDKWYKKHEEGGTYHKDDGEGLDNYHVGVSRGCGATCIFDKETAMMYSSKNYTKWNKIEDGALRASFELSYQPWEANGVKIKEHKTLTVDKGNNFSKYEVLVEGTDLITVGITLHEKDGESTINKENGWFSYWQPHAGSELGTALVVNPELVVDAFEYKVDENDQSHLFVTLKVLNGKVTYYSGFAWKESNQYPTKESWEAYLDVFTHQLANPFEVSYK